ncbi:stage V sporulation protein E [Clostridium sp. MSJ-8]|uniref:stage V sporulation protein E n=1 Tax=Clostridium sp. MSJ-8 TaxID=2841510 RepID=UPI001C0ECE6E|nr:stage V sporulation protein E [Clostridium sp. MSJ-8]MBU5487563.1 stage V sporulation protein E [Clostridium sp. MSJ-8]
MVKKKHQKQKNKLGRIDYGIFYSVVMLLAIGVVMVYSASSYYAMHNNSSSTAFLIKQSLAAGLGFIAMFFFMRFDYHILRRFSGILAIISVPLMLVVKLFPAVKGAQRWIQLGPLSLQPSEIAKYAVVLFLATNMAYKGEGIKKFWSGVVPYLAFGGFFAGLCLYQSNLSIATLIMIVTFILLFCDGARIKHLFLYIMPVLLAAVGAFAYFEPYRRERLLNFLDPWKDAQDAGYQLIQSFYALGAGGITGLGLGQSRQKTLYMPEPHNDFIFSIIGEELGYIGCLVIIILFLILIWRGIKVGLDAKDMFGTLLAIGITSVIGVQTIINIAVVTGSMPVTGVPLPFISYGGTSILITMSAIGILLNISRQRDESTINNNSLL